MKHDYRPTTHEPVGAPEAHPSDPFGPSQYERAGATLPPLPLHPCIWCGEPTTLPLLCRACA